MRQQQSQTTFHQAEISLHSWYGITH